MNVHDWYRDYLFFQTLQESSDPIDMRPAVDLRAHLQNAGSLLVQSNNPSLGQAFVSGELDAGTLLGQLKRYPLVYTDPNEASLCREICGMDTMLAIYVKKFIVKTGWALSADPSNAQWLLEVLEHPGMVAQHPGWFEKVIELHPWAWEVAMREQFFIENESQCREHLYDSTKALWAHPRILEKMLVWLHHRASASPHKLALAQQAWPQWMEHVQTGLEVHMQIMGSPDSSWSAASIFTKMYFADAASSLLSAWKKPAGEPLELGSLLEDPPRML